MWIRFSTLRPYATLRSIPDKQDYLPLRRTRRMKTLLHSSIVAAIAAISVCAFGQTNSSGSGTGTSGTGTSGSSSSGSSGSVDMSSLFQRLDTNHDGNISQSEFSSGQSSLSSAFMGGSSSGTGTSGLGTGSSSGSGTSGSGTSGSG